MRWLFLFGAIFCNIGGNLVLKRSAALDVAASSLGLSWSLVFGMGLFSFNLLFYFKALRHIPIVVAYPILIGLSVAGVTLGALFWLGERITMLHVLGMALVVGGILVLSLARGPL